jgi:hypothetical protein
MNLLQHQTKPVCGLRNRCRWLQMHLHSSDRKRASRDLLPLQKYFIWQRFSYLHFRRRKASPYFVSLQRNNAKGELFFSYNENVTSKLIFLKKFSMEKNKIRHDLSYGQTGNFITSFNIRQQTYIVCYYTLQAYRFLSYFERSGLYFTYIYRIFIQGTLYI